MKNKYSDIMYNVYSSNYNYITLLPWNKYNIVQCHNLNRSFNTNIKINKEQFM